MAQIRRSLAVRIGAMGWMPRLLPAITAIDLSLHRVTRGRVGVLDLAGLPNLVLTVPGRRSGIPRSTPLLCAPDRGRWLIAGSNFGQAAEPAWVRNLQEAGSGTVIWRGREHSVRSAELRGAERETAWQVLVGVWPNFRLYERRTNRCIRVFELAIAAQGPT